MLAHPSAAKAHARRTAAKVKALPLRLASIARWKLQRAAGLPAAVLPGVVPRLHGRSNVHRRVVLLVAHLDRVHSGEKTKLLHLRQRASALAFSQARTRGIEEGQAFFAPLPPPSTSHSGSLISPHSLIKVHGRTRALSNSPHAWGIEENLAAHGRGIRRHAPGSPEQTFCPTLSRRGTSFLRKEIEVSGTSNLVWKPWKPKRQVRQRFKTVKTENSPQAIATTRHA
jgi:hypothetical protein